MNQHLSRPTEHPVAIMREDLVGRNPASPRRQLKDLAQEAVKDLPARQN